MLLGLVAEDIKINGDPLREDIACEIFETYITINRCVLCSNWRVGWFEYER